MRVRVSSSVGRSAVRVLAAVLLASVATGCSSDSTRFGGLFSRGDSLTTSSVQPAGQPVPRGDVAGAGTAPMDAGRSSASAQPFPDPVSAAPVSRARVASTPMSVQRSGLAEPSAASETAMREPALRPTPQALPSASAKTPALAAPDMTKTASTPSKAGWSTANAPAVLLRQGDTIATLANRFGVPEKEILRANGLKRASDAEVGQRILIPTYGVASSAAKQSASDAATRLDVDKQKNTPVLPENRDVAILPTQAQSRDKGKGNADLNTGRLASNGEGGGAGTYTVKSGDSLNRIAKANNVSVEALRQANGLTSGAIRVGQTLTLPKAGAADPMTTASLPAKAPAVAPAAQPAAVKAEPVKAAAPAAAAAEPVAKQSVTEVASRDDGSDEAPKGTGISKYRWPVRGAVIAGYGANVEGSRNDGINISVPEGTPIKAAENGVVIYSGSSLKELGNAVLVRHDDGTVTVYGNASELMVQRGQKIQRGQTLAASGMSGRASQPQVHFEVRKNATAVNPATFLE